jgi:TctA family transporter
MVLGEKIEDAFRQSLILSQGSFGIFVANPLVATIMALAAALLLWPLAAYLIGVARTRRARDVAVR